MKTKLQRMSNCRKQMLAALAVSAGAWLARAGDEGPGTGGIGAGTGQRAGPPYSENGRDNDPCDTSSCTDPVELATGEFKQNRTDLELPGLIDPLDLTFHYRSQRIHNGRYGYGWFLNFEMRLFPQTNNNILWRMGTGEQQLFVFSGGGGSLYQIASPEFRVGLTVRPTGGWQILTRDRVKYLFDSNGLLTDWQDPAGNTVQIAWETSGSTAPAKFPIEGRVGEVVVLDYRIKEITSTLNKKVYFAYYGQSDGNRNGRLKSLADDYGRVVQYDYDNNGNLIEVRSPITTYRDETGAQVVGPRITNYTYSTGFRDLRLGAPESPLDHNLLTITDDRGLTQLVNVYDANDRVVSQEFYGGTTTIEYTLSGGAVTEARITDGDLFQHRYTFDAAKGFPKTSETKGSGVHGYGVGWLTTQYTYNTKLDLELVKRPKLNGVKLTYDDEGNVTESRRQTVAGAPPGPGDLLTSATYESTFNKVKSFTDELGHTTTYIYDYEENSLGDLNGDGVTSQAAGNLVRVERPDATKPDGTTQSSIVERYWYNNLGQLIRAIDAENRVVEWQYYPSGHAAFGLLQRRIVDPGGLDLTTEFTYDSYAFLATLTDPRGQIFTFIHNSVGELLEVQAPLGVRTRYEYDANGNVVLTETRNLDASGAPQDPEWITRVDAYDTWNRLASRTEDVVKSGGAIQTRTTQFGYDKRGNLAAVITPEGRVASFEYDERGVLFRTTRGVGSSVESTSRIELDQNGNVVKSLDGNGNITVAVYDLFDRLTSTTDPAGDAVAIEWSARDEPLSRSVIDPALGLMALMEADFDELGRVIRGRRVDVGSASNISEGWREYDKSGRMVKARSPRGHFTQLQYDDAGRLTLTTDALGNATELTLDLNGNVEVVTETDKHPGASDEVYVSNIVYDALNRATSIKRVDRLQPTHQPETQLKYDSRHNVVEVIDPIGRVMRTTYDLLSRPTLQVEDALGLAIDTSYNYDDDGLIAALTDADGQQTSWVHDPLGRVARVDYELGLFEAFTYDTADNVLTHRAQDGVITTHAYFSDNQLKDRTAGALKEEFDWNALGLPSAATVKKGGVTSSTLGFGYDGFGRVNRETAHGYDLLVGYDAGHNVTSLLYPDGLSVVKTYDELDRVQSVSDSSSTLSTYTWIGRSRLKSRTAGVVESYTWDGLRRLTRINAGAVQDLSYGYDDLDRRTWIQRTHQGGVGDVYDYDGGSRLSDVWYGASNPPSGTSGYSQHFEVDQTKADDRTSTSVNGASTSYNAADPLHRYTQIGSTARAYDAKGNLIDDGAQLYEYDAWNRLTRVIDKATQAERTRFELDAFGRRASRIQGSITQRYFYLGARLKSELRSVDEGPVGPLGGFDAQSQSSTNIPGANPWRDYVYGVGLDQAVAFYSGGVQYDGYHDALGSLTALVRRSTGALRERYSYDAFGAPSVTNGAGTPQTGTWGRPASVLGNELWFTGGRWDGESGNYHLRARQYEPAAGRFVSRDPLGYVDGPNPYVFGFSDPVNWTDPFGLQAQCAQSGPRTRTPKEQAAHERALGNADENRWLAERAHRIAMGLDVRLKAAYILQGAGYPAAVALDFGETMYAMADTSYVPYFQATYTANDVARAANQSWLEVASEATQKSALAAFMIAVPPIGIPLGAMLAADAIVNGDERTSWTVTGSVLGGAATRLCKRGTMQCPRANEVGVPKPNVIDPKLQNLVRDLYKGAKTKNPIGTGSTADAIRHERVTGQPVGGRFHTTKGREYSRALENWLLKQPDACKADRAAAQAILNDLRDALGGK